MPWAGGAFVWGDPVGGALFSLALWERVGVRGSWGTDLGVFGAEGRASRLG